MPINRRSLAAAVLVVPSVYATGAYASLVDLFNDPASPDVQEVTSTAEGEVGFSEYPGPDASASTSILGGYRDLIVEITDQGFANTSADLFVSDSLSYSNDSGVRSEGRVQWDGNDNSPSLDEEGLGGVDLVNQDGCPNGGCDRFIADILFTDQGLEYSIGVYTDASNYAILSAEAQFEVALGAPITEDFLFDWFLLDSDTYTVGEGANAFTFTIEKIGAGPTLTNVGALELVLFSESLVSLDLTIGAVSKTGPGIPPVVPEPGTLALLGLGALGAAVGSRRRNRGRS